MRGILSAAAGLSAAVLAVTALAQGNLGETDPTDPIFAPRPVVDLNFVNSVIDPRLTFSRSSTETYFDGTTTLKTAASGVPASPVFGQTTGVVRGYQAFQGVSHLLLQNRDGTNAAWTKSASMTAAKTATGLDGVANSATLLTAGAADQTICNTRTSASGTRSFAIYLKRVSGSGEVDISFDQSGTGPTWTDVTSQISTSWTRVPTSGLLGPATITNPTGCVRLRNSGDHVAFDFAEILNANVPAPGATVTTATVATTSDVLTLPFSAVPQLNPADFTAVMAANVPFVSTADAARYFLNINDGTSSNAIRLFQTGTTGNVISGSAVGAGVPCSNPSAISASGLHYLAISYKAGQFGFSVDRGPDLGATGCTPVGTFTQANIGHLLGVSQMNGQIRRLMFFNGARFGNALGQLAGRVM